MTWADEEGNEHESEEAYEYYILHVTLRNHSLGTVAVGKGAVDCGLIDQVGGLGDALDYLRQRIQENRDREKTETPDQTTDQQQPPQSAPAVPASAPQKGGNPA